MNDHGDAIVAFDLAHFDEPARDVLADEHREAIVLVAHRDRMLVRVHDRFVAYAVTTGAVHDERAARHDSRIASPPTGRKETC